MRGERVYNPDVNSPFYILRMRYISQGEDLVGWASKYGGGGVTRIGQVLIVIIAKILPQRTQKPESAGKKCVRLISLIGLFTKFQSFLLFLEALITDFVFFI